MSTEVWTPTHRAPAAGAACWATPDGTLAPLAQRLEPGLDVRLLERLGDWAHVECSNGWTAWVDARALEQVAAAAPPPPPPAPPPPAAGASFQPTHAVPAGGLAAYAEHDVAQAPQATLDPALPVQVLERWGDWANVACSNGWTAWVDGRQLLPRATTASAPAPGGVWSFSWAPGVGPFALGGAALVLISSALPWLGVAGFSVNAWDLRLVNLVTLGSSTSDTDVRVGFVLLGVLLLVVPILLHRPLPAVRALAASLPMEMAILAGIYAFRFSPHLDLGAGIFVAFLGGLAMFADRWLTRHLLPQR